MTTPAPGSRGGSTVRSLDGETERRADDRHSIVVGRYYDLALNQPQNLSWAHAVESRFL